MLSIIALIVRILSNPCSNLFQKKIGASGAISLWISFFSYFTLSVFSLFFVNSTNWQSFNLDFWTIVICTGIVGAFGNWFLVEAIKCGELSILGPINTYKSIVSILFALVLLKELPNFTQFFGIIFIIIGSYFIFDAIGEKFTPKIFLRRDIRYRIFALILTALEAVFIKKIVLIAGVSTAFILWCTSSALFSFLILLFLKTDFKRELLLVNKSNLKFYFCLACTLFLMQISSNIVFEKINVSCALALFQLSSLISVIFGWKYFGEKQIKKKIFGTIIMIFGSIIIILS